VLALGFGLGFSDQPSLTLTHGGLITPSAAIAAVAGMASGQLTVGAGGQIDVDGLLDIGVRDTGIMLLQDGGIAYCDSAILGDIVGGTPPMVAAGNGTVTLTGAGSAWTIHQNLIVGNRGPGALNILDGADVTANAQGGHTSLADFPGISSTMLVSGAGSTFTTPGEMVLGYEGLGTVTVAAGGRINSGSVISDFGAGVVNIDGAGSLWVNAGAFTPDGPITITNGGELRCGLGFVGNDTVSVSGAGSKWTVTGDLSVGSHNGAQGVLSITNGAMLTTDECLIEGASAESSVHIIGAGSSGAASLLRVGAQGDGRLEVASGAHMTCGMVRVGEGVGVEGVVTVFGPESMLDAGTMIVGDRGQALVQVGYGAHIDSTMIVGQNAGSLGQVAIVGAGSRWTGNAWIGFAGGGTGAVGVSAGGRFESTVARIGTSSSAGGGTVVITGAGSTWIVTEELEVGVDGTGLLTVSNGGTVTAAEVIVGPTGLLNGHGQVIGSIDNFGEVSPGLYAGVLEVNGSFTQHASGALNMEIAGAIAGTHYDRLSVTGDMALDGTLNVTLLSGFQPAAGDHFEIIQAIDGTISGEFDSASLPPGFHIIYQRDRVLVALRGPNCPADVDGSGAVDADDLVAVVLAWGKCPAPPALCDADVDDSGAVDADDLVEVILAWGPCQ
jgi:T5SS/PEP-CTERM-associated repeat protein